MPEVGYFTGLLHKLHYWLAIRFTTNYTQLTIWALVVCYNETAYYAATKLKATSSVIVIGEKKATSQQNISSQIASNPINTLFVSRHGSWKQSSAFFASITTISPFLPPPPLYHQPPPQCAWRKNTNCDMTWMAVYYVSICYPWSMFFVVCPGRRIRFQIDHILLLRFVPLSLSIRCHS